MPTTRMSYNFWTTGSWEESLMMSILLFRQNLLFTLLRYCVWLVVHFVFCLASCCYLCMVSVISKLKNLQPIYAYSLCSLWICLLRIIFCERSRLLQLQTRNFGICNTLEMSMWRIFANAKVFWREFSEDQQSLPCKWKLGNVTLYFSVMKASGFTV